MEDSPEVTAKRVVDPDVAEAAAQIISEAVEIMIRHGQAQGVTYKDAVTDRVCVLGALSLASGHRSVPAAVAGETIRAMHRAVRRAGFEAGTLSLWNDQHDQETVIKVMRQAVDQLRSGDFG